MTAANELLVLVQQALGNNERVLIKGGPFGNWTDITDARRQSDLIVRVATPAIASGHIFMPIDAIAGVQIP